jgi:hypothetical protein
MPKLTLKGKDNPEYGVEIDFKLAQVSPLFAGEEEDSTIFIPFELEIIKQIPPIMLLEFHKKTDLSSSIFFAGVEVDVLVKILNLADYLGMEWSCELITTVLARRLKND